MAGGERYVSDGFEHCKLSEAAKLLMHTVGALLDNVRELSKGSGCPIHVPYPRDQVRTAIRCSLKDASKLRADSCFLQAVMSYPYQPLNVPVSHSVKPTSLEDPLGLSLSLSLRHQR